MGPEPIVTRDAQFLERIDGPGALARNAVVLTAPRSLAAERYRLVQFRLEQICRRDALKTIAVASAMPGEGRTTTAMNLALTAARAGDRRVALVEADLRRPRLERLLGLPEGPGIADLSGGEVEMERCVRRVVRPPLWVVTAGRRAGGAEVELDVARLRALLALLRSRFDVVYVDVPPVLSSADAVAVVAAVDGIVLVARPRRSTFASMEQAASMLSGARVLGCVLNDSLGLLTGAELGRPPRGG